ncbi:MAG: accessory gene regulator B family protein [Lachnospiraceae bacterium]|nr:accessory gene regulator B family protein [Lachnospiraceae bacterium]
MTDLEKREIIDYGLYRLKIILISIVTTLLLGWILEIFVQSVCFLLGFLAIRRYAGGYHAKTQKICFLISFLVLCISFLIFRSFEQRDMGIVFVANILYSIFIWYLAPVDNPNKRLDYAESEKYRICVRKVLLIDNLILVMMYEMRQSNIFFGISISIWITCIAVVAGRIVHQADSTIQLSDEYQ